MNEAIIKLNGLDCASCADKIKIGTEKLDGVTSSNIDFVNSKLTIKLDKLNDEDEFINNVREIVNKFEPGVIVELIEIKKENSSSNEFTLMLEGLDCAGCAGEIVEYVEDLKYIEQVDLNFVTKKMIIGISDNSKKNDIINKIISKMKQLEPSVNISEIKEDKKIKTITLELQGLDCAGCADNIVQYAETLDNITNVELNFVSRKLNLELDNISEKNRVIKDITIKMKQLEPHVVVKDLSKTERIDKFTKLKLELEGLDCAGCADGILQFSEKLDGVDKVDLNFVGKTMTLQLSDMRLADDITEKITKKMKELEPGVVVSVTGDKKNKLKNKEIEDESKNNIFSQNKELAKIIIAGILFLIPTIFKFEGTPRFLMFFISYLVIGTDVIVTALRNIKAGNPMDEHFLMTVATIGAFVIGEYPEGVAVMLFYQIGEYFQARAVNHSRKNIKALMDIRPDYANLVVGDKTVVVDPDEIEVGDIILIRPGEKVPLDGIVIEGESTLDTSNITGESVPRSIKVGEDIISGVVNNSGLLKVEVKKEFGDSTITKILDLVENASSKKAPTENFITKFSRYYTPIVVYVALAIGVIPPLLFGGVWAEWAYRAFVFLVISCPCALVISVPLGFFGGIGAASKEGVLIKGGNYLEALNDLDTIVFDKTGTITKGTFKVTNIKTYSNYKDEDILEIAAYGESYSTHPIGVSIIDAYNKEIDKNRIEVYEDIAGKGIKAQMGGVEFLLGNKSLLDMHNIKVNAEESIGTVVYIAEGKEHIGTIVVSDEIKPGVEEALKELKKLGIKETIMLSGDNTKTVDKVAKIAGLDKAYGELLPQDKVIKFEEIIDSRTDNKKVAFVGDGVNDAPVLARADLGIAMGGLGSDAAIEASDIVIMTDEIGKIATGMKIARKTKRIVTQNIVLAIGVKLIVLLLGAMGQASMWQAVFADVGVSIIAIFNSIRALKVDE